MNGAFCQPTNAKPPIRLAVIPTLPKSDICQQTLERILREFDPIIRSRGYNVLSVSELCCCGDGLDHIGDKRRKRRRRMPATVLGYNQTTTTFRRGGGNARGPKSHTIHLRLRHPTHHADQLYPWEDVAGTMAHELSHCVHSNHSPAFYKLMEDILEEHATNQVNGMGVWNPSSESAPYDFATTGGQRLGGTKGGASRLMKGGFPETRTGHRLGGKPLAGTQDPHAQRERLAEAAERRRQQMQRIRQQIQKNREPCVIEIDDDDSDIDGVSSEGAQVKQNQGDRKGPQPKVGKRGAPIETNRSGMAELAQKKPKHTPEVIDLQSPIKEPKSATPLISASTEEEEVIPWSCQRCTFENKPMALMCSMCFEERSSL
eukprot:Nitzschia sp. Nitz4//scaffold35_size145790//117564//118685//NITZ4_003050-RA/size145790-processed-gene-0.102-mRNA-1//-1//CDS//3329549184//4845//frame0